MLIYFILLNFIYKVFTQTVGKCLATIPNTPYCLTCSANSSAPLTMVWTNDAFPSSYCFLRNSGSYIKEIFVDPTSTCTTCDGSTSNPYNNLLDAFLSEDKAAKSFKNIDIKFYLMAGSHYLTEEDVKKYNPKLTWLLVFKGLIGNISIQPCYKTKFASANCFNPNEKAKIVYKTERVHLFVSLLMVVSNVTFMAEDLANPKPECQVKTKLCCPMSSYNDSSNTDCYFTKKIIAISSEQQFLYLKNSLFVLENTFDANPRFIPELILDNVDVLDFITRTSAYGFMALIDIFQLGGNITIRNCKFQNIFFYMFPFNAFSNSYLVKYSNYIPDLNIYTTILTGKINILIENSVFKDENIYRASFDTKLPISGFESNLISLKVRNTTFDNANKIHPISFYRSPFIITPTDAYAPELLFQDVVIKNCINFTIIYVNPKSFTTINIINFSGENNEFQDSIDITNSKLFLKNVSFTNNSLSTSTFKLTYSQVEVTNITLVGNIQKGSELGSFILFASTYLNSVKDIQQKLLKISNDTFFLDTAFSKLSGVIIFQSSHSMKSFKIVNFEYKSNSKETAIFVIPSIEDVIDISVSKFEDILNGNTDLFNILYPGTFKITEVFILNSTFSRFFSIISIQDINFKVTIDKILVKGNFFNELFNFDGLYVSNGFNVTVLNSLFKNNQKKDSISTDILMGTFFLCKGREFIIQSSVFKDNFNVDIYNVNQFYELDSLQLFQIAVMYGKNKTISNFITVNAINTKFTNISTIYVDIVEKITSASFFSLITKSFLMSSSIFQNLNIDKGLLFTIIIGDASKLSITNCKFINVVSIFDSTILSLKSNQKIWTSNLDSIISNFKSSNDYFKALSYGILNCYFLNVGNSSLFELQDNSEIAIFNCTFSRIYGKIIYFGTNSAIIVSNISFANIINKNEGKSILNGNDGSYVMIFHSSFQSIDSIGGITRVQNGNLEAYNLILTDIKASEGGFASMVSSVAKVSLISMINSSVDLNGGLIIAKLSSIDLSNIQIMNSTSNLDGCMVSGFKTSFKIKNSNIQNCSSKSGKGAIFVIECPGVTNIIQDIFFSNGTSKEGTFLYSINTQMVVQNITLIKNYGENSLIYGLFESQNTLSILSANISNNMIGKLIYFKNSILIFENMTSKSNYLSTSSEFSFENCFYDIKNVSIVSDSGIYPYFGIQGGKGNISLLDINLLGSKPAFIVKSVDFLNIINSSFTNCFSSLTNPCISLIDDKQVNLNSNYFKQSFGDKTQAIIYSDKSNLSIINSQFEGNSITEGYDIEAENIGSTDQVNIVLESNRFQYSSTNFAVYLFGIQNLDMKLCNFTGITNGIKGAVKIEDSQNIRMNSNSFVNFKNYSTISISNIQTNPYYLLLSNNLLMNNEAISNGGCLYLKGFVNGIFEKNNFTNCKSQGSGGGIYYSCSSNTNCKLQIDSTNIFLNNLAGIEGWAISSEYVSVQNQSSLTILFPEISSNTKYVPIYSSPIKLIFSTDIDKALVEQNIKKSNISSYKVIFMNETDTSFITLDTSSGGKLNFMVTYLDEYGNIYQFPNTVILKFKKFDDNQKNQFFENENKLFDQNFFSFENFVYISQFDGIHEAKALINYKNYNLSFNVKFALRKCVLGEIYLNFRCLKCPLGTYSVVSDPNLILQTTRCENCPINSECVGGNNIIPDAGSWRKDNLTSFVVKCPLNTCFPKQLINGFINECKEGYQGNLCKRCAENFGNFNNDRCVDCSNSLYLFLKFLIFIGFLAVNAIQIYIFFFVSRNPFQKNIVKTFTNYFIFLSLFSQFNLNLQFSFNETFLMIFNYLPIAPYSILFLNCGVGNSLKDTVKKYSLISVNPFFTVIPLIFFQFVLLYVYKEKLKNNSNLLRILKIIFQAFIISFYNFYHIFSFQFFNSLKCINLSEAPEEYLLNDPDIICWGKIHNDIIYSVAFPSLLLLTIMIPFIFIILRRVQLNTKNEKMKYLLKPIKDFLFYDHSFHNNYWETIIFCTKFALISLTYLTLDLSPFVTKSLISTIFFFNYLGTRYIAPYKSSNEINERLHFTMMANSLGLLILDFQRESQFIEIFVWILLTSLNIVYILDSIGLLKRILNRNMKQMNNEVKTKKVVIPKTKEVSLVNKIELKREENE